MMATLRFECDGCGACCRTFSIFAARSDAEREPRIKTESLALPEHVEGPGFAYKLFPLPFLEACCFLDSQDRCDVYATRPDVCRDFDAGSEQCQDARSRQGLSRLESVP